MGGEKQEEKGLIETHEKVFTIFDDEKNKCNIYRLDTDSRIIKIHRIRNHPDLNLYQVLNHRLIDLIVYEEIAEKCRQRIQKTMETGQTTFAILPVRLPNSRKIITRAVRFEKRVEELFLFVEPEPESDAHIRQPKYNTFRIDQFNFVVNVLVSTDKDPAVLKGKHLSNFFPYWNEADIIRKHIKLCQNAQKEIVLRAIFKLPGRPPFPATCRITPFIKPDSLITIKEILDTKKIK